MELPYYIKKTIEDELSNHHLSDISNARKSLTNDYRNKKDRPDRFINSKEEIVAYLAVRLPATYAVFASIIKKVAPFIDTNDFTSLLDLGSGSGTVMYAMIDFFLELNNITLIERDKFLIEKGKSISNNSDYQQLKQANWICQDLKNISNIKKHHVVTSSYVLNEIENNKKEAFINEAWDKTEKMFILVEPGTPQGFNNIKNARSQIIDLGGKIIAPCPSQNICPIIENDWCHFSQRVQRTKYQRLLKEGTESYEDEKFSYIVSLKDYSVSKDDLSRIIRHPQIHKGHIDLKLCTEKGLNEITISKKENELYKKARKIEWGDLW
ncbi:MAG: rRNA methyltransferase [Candidatus Sericytochromatia bacterium]|nr:rRNA methyltransferase [Candidatus Sericytochromatia bacterium]